MKLQFALHAHLLAFAMIVGSQLTTASVVHAQLAHAQPGNAQAEASKTSSQRSPSSKDSTESSVRQTQELMRDQRRLEQEGLHSPEARHNHEQVKQLMGDEADTAAVYAIAAELLGPLAAESGGDPSKMLEVLEALMGSPEGMSSKLTADQLKRIQDLAKRVEKRKNAN